MEIEIHKYEPRINLQTTLTDDVILMQRKTVVERLIRGLCLLKYCKRALLNVIEFADHSSGSAYKDNAQFSVHKADVG